MPSQTLQALEKKIEQRIRFFERKGVKLDEVRFIRSWLEKPLSVGAVTPSGRVLARTMARYVDPRGKGPVVELGPGTGPVTEALVARGIDPARLVLVEFNPTFCRLLRTRYPEATVVQGDAYALRHLLSGLLDQPAAAIVSGLPLLTRPPKVRTQLLADALSLMAPGAPFVQFSYAMVPPVSARLAGVKPRASKVIWMNVPPARVYVYRREQ